METASIDSRATDTPSSTPESRAASRKYYKLPQGSLTPEQKQDIIHKTTDILALIYGDAARAYTMVLVDEVTNGEGAFADEVLTLAKLKAKS